MSVYDLLVIGGGAAGMMAAGRAAERGKRVLLLEKNAQLGAKLAITGGGRCNITNAEENQRLFLAHFGKAEKFLYSSFAQFDNQDAMRFFTDQGLPTVVQAGQRAFPKTERAEDVVRLFVNYLACGKVEVRKRTTVETIRIVDGKIAGVVVGKELMVAKNYLLATGGRSHPETGSTGDGFRWLAKLGHTVVPPTPTIVPLAVADTWVKNLAGVALDDVHVSFFQKGQKLLQLKGRILCTHFGLSGPLILNAAGKVGDMLRQGKVTVSIDVFPKLDFGSLDKHITKVFDQNKNKVLKNVLRLLTPTGTAASIITLLPRVLHEKKIHSISQAERKALGQLLKALPITVQGLMGYEWAVVADGGVPIREVDGKTFRSRKYDNLFITGDLLHITRPSGGYSLQLCWTSGYVAGNHT
ncbi:MAG: aminoacetone oxidase family FAD-binding enzyme [Patescibacteria group bacterium]|jgi:hypothetical protein